MPRGSTITTTIGWQPGCECGHTDTIMPIVFDPFGGSGTTAIVARNLGRRAIMLDLSMEYLQKAQSRMSLGFGSTAQGGNGNLSDLPMFDLLTRKER